MHLVQVRVIADTKHLPYRHHYYFFYFFLKCRLVNEIISADDYLHIATEIKCVSDFKCFNIS